METNPESPLVKGGKLDLVAATRDSRAEVTFKPRESPEEISSRLRVGEMKARFEEWRNVVITGALMICLVVILMGCMIVVAGSSQSANSPNGYSSEDKKTAATLLVSAFTGAFGYIAGRQSK